MFPNRLGPRVALLTRFLGQQRGLCGIPGRPPKGTLGVRLHPLVRVGKRFFILLYRTQRVLECFT